MFGKLKLYLVLLVSMAITLNACSNTEQRSNSVPPATTSPSTPETTPSTTSQAPTNQPSQAPNQEDNRPPESTPSEATDSSSPGKTTGESKFPTRQPGETPQQDNSTAKDTASSLQAARENYKPMSLAKLTKSNAETGDDPKAVAVSAFGNVASEGGSRDVTVNYPQPNHAVVTITQTGVADDSIRSIRYRTELVPTSKSVEQTRKQWKLVWAGSQVKCQPGRGSQDWTTQLCQ